MVRTFHTKPASVDYKVERAKKHLIELEREISAFLATEPYRIDTKPHPNQPNGAKYYVASTPSKQPISIPLIVGDVLFNLRAALDHLAYQLAVNNGTTDKKILRETSFPILDSAKLYGKISRDKMKGMSQVAKDAIDAVKPYKEGNTILWQLHSLNNIDKHRTVVTVGLALGWHSLPTGLNQSVIDTLKTAHANNLVSDWEDVFGSHTPSEIVSVNVRPAIRKCPLEIGDELTLAWDDPAIHQNAELKFTFEVAFAEPGIIQSQPVLAALKDMASAIDNIIIDFKPLLDREY
jgi:hypothetical protein